MKTSCIILFFALALTACGKRENADSTQKEIPLENFMIGLCVYLGAVNDPTPPDCAQETLEQHPVFTASAKSYDQSHMTLILTSGTKNQSDIKIRKKYEFPVSYEMESKDSVLITHQNKGGCYLLTRLSRNQDLYFEEDLRQWGSCDEAQVGSFKISNAKGRFPIKVVRADNRTNASAESSIQFVGKIARIGDSDWGVFWRLSQDTGDTYGYYFATESDIGKKLLNSCRPNKDCILTIEYMPADSIAIRQFVLSGSPEASVHFFITNLYSAVEK